VLNIILEQDKVQTASSREIKVEPEKKYLITTEVKGIKGELYSAYFGIVIRNEDGKEIARKIRWLNDFSGSNNKIQLITKIPTEGNKIIIIYRFNEETPLKSEWECQIKSPDEVEVSQTTDDAVEDFDLPDDYILPKIKELSQKEEELLEENLVWLFSYARSGTSWLAGQLLSHKTKFFNEPLIGAHLVVLAPFVLTNKIIRNRDLYYNQPNYFFAKRYENTWKFFLRKLILNRIHAQFDDLSSKIIIKEPNGSFAVDLLSEVFPKSKIIILIRDGRDMIDSKVDSLQKDSWGTKEGVFSLPESARLGYIRFHSHSWIKIVELLMKTYQSHAKGLSYKLRYEDLLIDTSENLKQLYDFIGVDINENDLKKIIDKYTYKNLPTEAKGKGKVVRSASPGLWKKNLTKKEQGIMNSIMGKTLKEMNYDT